ncbi:unnamed protein product [Adineta ricciae]|uniref:Protein kinase domain-containing protein n=1 Tax=Adineta ricciae TaxID=249248 RepID=A0A814V1D9_ADIRI|nr:unnamed protein product [Adineta ricciae]
MDSTINNSDDIPSKKDESSSTIQINPPSIMTSITSFKPVDDNEENILDTTNIQRTRLESNDRDTSLSEKSSDQLNLPKMSANVHMDERAVAAWVQSTTAETVSSPIERSPSLPASMLEQISTRSRRNSTVSTLCDQTQSQLAQTAVFSDTMSSTVSYNLSTTMDIQRSFSFPTVDQHQYSNLDNEQNQFISEENEDDITTQFLPVPESEDSEIDKQSEKPLVSENAFLSNKHSSTGEERKISSNVSFHASVSFDPRRKSLHVQRRRNNSWNTNKNKPVSYQRSVSHKPALVDPRVNQKQYFTSSSVPSGIQSFLSHRTNQSSSYSDNVFLSTSAISSPLSLHHANLVNHIPVDSRFLAIPSSTSMISSDQQASNVSDASGQSGIESSNLRTSISELPHTASINEEEEEEQQHQGSRAKAEKNLLHLQPKRSSSGSSRSTQTASTESLATSSSEDRVNNMYKKLDVLNKVGKKPRTPYDQRLDVLRQLAWLLEKRPPIHSRLNPTRRKPAQALVSARSSMRSTNTTTVTPHAESELTITSKASPQLFSSSNENSNQVHSLPINSHRPHSPSSSQALTSYVDPLTQSYSSIRSIHSDSSLNPCLINTKAPSSNPNPGTTSLNSSLHLQRNTSSSTNNQSQRRRTGQHRRNFSGRAAVHRDRKNSFTKSNTNKLDEQSTTSQISQQHTGPLVRDIKAILEEHLAMINDLLLKHSCNASIQYPSQNSCIRDYLYTRLSELSLRNPMNQRCSRVETKAFIDSITTYNLNRSHHYHFLIQSIRDLSKPVRLSNETKDDLSTIDDTLLNSSLSNSKLTEFNNNVESLKEHPLRFFRTLTDEYILDCEQTEKDLTQKLYDIADKQYILYCLKHVDSGHTNDLLSVFHSRLDAMFVWYNLYYELTISVKKLSGLLRCDDCDDWPKLHFRSLATERERKAKRADESDYYTTSEDDSTDDEADVKTTEESDIDNESEQMESGIGKTESGDEIDAMPKNIWPDDAYDQFSSLKISDDSQQTNTNPTPQKIDRTKCYRNFVYYMDKRSYQVKYDGLARTLIERVAPVLVKTRLALLQTSNRRDIKVEQVLAGLSLCDFQSTDKNQASSTANTNNDDIDDKLVDTDNPVKDDTTANLNIGELTIEKWLHRVLESCSTIKTICSHTEDILKHNWLEIHEQLGLPSLLPLYFFIVNVLLDVMNECLSLYMKPYMNNDIIEIDALCRQQLVREAKLVLRDALATRLYSVRMMEQFISNRQIADELADFDEKIVNLYMHYKQFLSTVSINRTYDIHDDTNPIAINETDRELYYYVDEETSELIKEYYFARDLTLTLGNRELIHALGSQFNDLVRGILAQLKEELNETTENYYQVFAADTTNASSASDGIYSADVMSESTKPPYFHSSTSVPPDFSLSELSICDASASLSEQKKCEIIFSTREFRRSFDKIKQRTIRICSLAKTLINDFSIAAEFKCYNYVDLWHDLKRNDYSQVKLHLDSSNSNDFDSFYLFVPPWLSNDKNQVEKLLNIICSQQFSTDEMKASNSNPNPAFMIFVPKRNQHLQNISWTGNVIFIRASESTQLALNSTELPCLHLVVTRSDHWKQATDLFQYHTGSTNNNIQLVKKLARDEDIRLTFDQLPEQIDRLSNQLTELVRTLNTIWDQDSIKIFLMDIVKFDERQLRTIESKLLDLVLYVYNSGFELFRLLYELLPPISVNDDKILKKFVSTMNEFFCEWCKCVTKKFKYASIQQARTAKYKVLRPRWFSPGMVFLGFLAKPPHLQLLTEYEYSNLMTEMPVALKALRGSTLNNHDSPVIKARSNSVSSTPTMSGRPRNRSSASGHRRFDSGGGTNELLPFISITPLERIQNSIKARENELEQKLRERKQIGQIFNSNSNNTATSSSTLDPGISLKTRNIAFPWRRGTRIGQGGAGVAFRAINSSNGSIVCMKEIQLSSIASRSLPSTYPEKLRRIAEEIDMIMSINHPNIVRYFGIEKYKRTIYICMEYCLSTVNEFLNDIRAFQHRAHSRKSISGLWTDSSDQDDEINTDNIHVAPSLNVYELVRGFVKQLLQALLALHEHCIVHCDVKGDNIFIANENGHYIVKLGDFNLSHRLELESPSGNVSDSRSTQFGTLYFKPPEPEYVYQSDIWALGCTVIEMLTGKHPWANVVRPQEERLYIQNQLLAKKGPPIPDELKEHHEAYDFIGLCLIPDLNERPLAKALLDHPYPRVRTDS